jgi:hypothetical protein
MPLERDAAVQLPADPAEHAALLARIHDAVLSGAPAPGTPRSVVSDSWSRSLRAQVDPELRNPPQVYLADELAEVRAAHPLAAVLPLLRATLVSVADEAMHVMIVTDAEGHILWREGPSAVKRGADRVNLAEGTRWTEDSIGTNAMGTALAVDRAVQIFSAEHLARSLHAWTCAAAPIHDPDTGRVLGVVDISGPLRTVHPATLALVSAAAQLAEGHLRVQMNVRDEQLVARNLRHLEGAPAALATPTGRIVAASPGGWLAGRLSIPAGDGRLLLADGREALVEPLSDGYLVRAPDDRVALRRPRLALAFLGADRPVAVLNGRELPLTLRHAEVLALLAFAPTGLTADQLALHLYGDAGNPVTARAEMHRLRTQLGADVVATKPYRLRADVDADFLAVRSLLDARDVGAAVRLHRGALLPRSEAPTIRAEREELLAGVRRGVLDRGDVEALWTFAQTGPGRDDAEVFERLVRTLPRTDPRHATATSRLLRLG